MNQDTKTCIQVFSIALAAMALFMALSYMIGQPHRTNSFLLVIAVMVLSTLVLAFAESVGSWLIKMLNISSYVVYVAAGLAFANILVSSAWNLKAYRPSLSAWVIVLAIPFALTHMCRKHIAKSVLDRDRSTAPAETVAEEAA